MKIFLSAVLDRSWSFLVHCKGDNLLFSGLPSVLSDSRTSFLTTATMSIQWKQSFDKLMNRLGVPGSIICNTKTLCCFFSWAANSDWLYYRTKQFDWIWLAKFEFELVQIKMQKSVLDKCQLTNFKGFYDQLYDN